MGDILRLFNKVIVKINSYIVYTYIVYNSNYIKGGYFNLY